MSSIPPPLPTNATGSATSGSTNTAAGNAGTGNAGAGITTTTSPPTTTTQQTLAQPQQSLPQQLATQLQSGQVVRGTILPPTGAQVANQSTLQTAFGNITVTGQNLPPANTQLSLALSLGANAATPTQTTGQTSTVGQFLQLSWQAPSNVATNTAHASGSTPVTLSTLQGSQITGQTLSQSSVSHLLPQGENATTQGNHGPIAANQNLSVRITGIQMPTQNSLGQPITVPQLGSIPISNIQGVPLQATVLASQAGSSIVQTPIGAMTLPTNQALPVGSILTLLPLAEPTAMQPISNNISMQERWAGLKQAMTMIQAGNPQAAQQIMQSLPQPNNQMASSMLFLISTLRGGALENWLGKSGSNKIPGTTGDRLTESIRQSTRKAKDSAGQDWKVFGIPVQQDGDLGDLWLYLKDKSDEEAESTPNDDVAKRFVIETNFQKMGPLQLDGLATRSHIDLMLRSHIPVEREMMDEIRALFGNTITALGLTGTIRFHVADNFPVTFTDQTANLGKSVTV